MEIVGDIMQCLLRPVKKTDSTLLYEWRNDSLVRKNSFNGNEINSEDHQNWLDDTLNNPDIFFFIMESAAEQIGQVRLNRTDNLCVVSYSIAEKYRVQGYGKLILQLAENQCVVDNIADCLAGYVKKSNIASQIIFRSLGYSETDEGDFYRYFKAELNYTDLSKYDKNLKAGGGVLLTNNKNSLPLYTWLIQRANAAVYSEKISVSMMREINPSLVISYNYNYIIKPDVIAFLNNKIINLHISLLPWNRGTSPNFWSFIEDTPKGVTIHQIDSGLDTGAIIVQKQIFFDENVETLASSYQKLQDEIQELFKNNFYKIINQNYSAEPSNEKGSFHRAADIQRLIGGTPPYHVKIRELKSWISGRCP